ncbi:MAG: PKD domain-containing protein [Vicinamibacterales bacterium]
MRHTSLTVPGVTAPADRLQNCNGARRAWTRLAAVLLVAATAVVARADGTSPIITTFAGGGASNADGVAATDAHLEQPSGIAVDQHGNVFFADNYTYTIRRVDGTTGLITTVAGGGEECLTEGDPCGDDGPATAASLLAPLDVAVDEAGNLFIADTWHHRIRRVDAATGSITTVAGSGNGDPFVPPGDGGPATEAVLNYPESVAVDADGNLYIADTVHRLVRRVDAASGIITTVIDQDTLYWPRQVALDAEGQLFVMDASGTGNRVYRIDTLTLDDLTLIAGTDSGGSDGSSGQATDAFLGAGNGADVAPDGLGGLYVANTLRVWRIDLATGEIGHVAGSDPWCYMTGAETCGDGGPADVARFSNIHGIAASGDGTLYISDEGNQRVRWIAGPGGPGGPGPDPDPVPSAVLTVPPTLAFGEDLVASAAGSTDADGTIVRYTWQLDAAPPVVTDVPTHTFPAPSPGAHTVTLVVTDDAGNVSAPASAGGRRRAGPGADGGADGAGDCALRAGPRRVRGRVGRRGRDDRPVPLAARRRATRRHDRRADPATRFRPRLPGAHTVTLVVTDDGGNVSAPASAGVVVEAGSGADGGADGAGDVSLPARPSSRPRPGRPTWTGPSSSTAGSSTPVRSSRPPPRATRFRPRLPAPTP